MQYYRETGIYAERTAPWLKRLGFDHVKEVLLDEQRHYTHPHTFSTSNIFCASLFSTIASQGSSSSACFEYMLNEQHHGLND
jgi:NAD(P)H-nitrite reductase large subunit